MLLVVFCGSEWLAQRVWYAAALFVPGVSDKNESIGTG